jgi:hypothetical protein
MRSILRSLALAPIAAALVTSAAMAETTLTVPFSFTAAGKTCPAGTYAVERDDLGTTVTLRSKDVAKSFTWNVGPADPAPANVQVILKFDEIGQDHALRSIQYESTVTSNLDKKSKHAEHVSTQMVQGQ